ncbi:MFS transporter [Pyrenochaeta sp. DS3sAY3a]|nr:MFS transporter [Pyrenochaeta sp. DS3sAY3a]
MVGSIIGMSWGSAVFGYAGSIIGTTLGQPSFIKYMGLDTASNAADLIGAMNALFFVGGLFGSLITGHAADKFGRRMMIIVGAVIVLISTALLAGSVNMAMFIVFRFTQGFGSFIELATVPLWISEVVPPKDRGILVDIHPIFINVGYLLASYVGVGFYYYQGTGKEWRYPLAIGCLPCLIVIVCAFCTPESPRHLIRKGQEDKAWEVLCKWHAHPNDTSHEYAAEEFAMVKRQIAQDEAKHVSFKEFVTAPVYRKRLLIGVGLPFVLMSSGVLVINNYGTLLYGSLGFGPSQQLHFQAGWLAVSFVMNVLAVLIVDRVPRHILITIGLVGAGSSVIVECAIQANFLGSTNKSALSAGVAMLYVYVFFYGVFLDGPTYFYLGEIFPNHLRARGMALGMASLCLANIIWLQAAPTAFANIGWKYYLFSIIITFLGAIWAFTSFPDTRNVPLEEIGALFGDCRTNDLDRSSADVNDDTEKATATEHREVVIKG